MAFRRRRTLHPAAAAEALAWVGRQELTGGNPYEGWAMESLTLLGEDLLIELADEGGWTAVGAWRYAAVNAPELRADPGLRAAFLRGLEDVLSSPDGPFVLYQADDVEEALIRAEPRGAPAWRIVPRRGIDMEETTGPAPGGEPAITPLGEGEEREVARFGVNRLVVRQEGGQHLAQLQNDGAGYTYATGDSLVDVLRAVGQQIGYQGPSWVSPELDPYITTRPSQA